MEDSVFFWLILDAFHWVLLSVGLIGSSNYWNESFGFPEAAHPFQSHHVHTITFFGWRSAFGVVGDGSFCLPRDIFHLHYYTVCAFYHPSQFIQKTKCFCYVLSRELHSEIWSRRLCFFFLMCSPNIFNKSSYHSVLIFSGWVGYSEYVTYLPCGIKFIVLHVSVWLLSPSTGLPNRGASSSKKSLPWNWANHFWHIWSVTRPFLYTLQIFLCASVAFLPWNNKAYYSENVAFFPFRLQY